MLSDPLLWAVCAWRRTEFLTELKWANGQHAGGRSHVLSFYVLGEVAETLWVDDVRFGTSSMGDPALCMAWVDDAEGGWL
jgi:hypothetical protein